MVRFASRNARLAIGAGILVLGSALPAAARSYKGWGDTGWGFYDKRDCCEEAVWLAQEDSISLCYSAGGRPRVRSGSTRGLCDWEASGDGSDRLYRCTAETSVDCR